MPQFFVQPAQLAAAPIVLRGPDARHITDVLRLQAGDWIVLCDGAGRRYEAVIQAMRPLHVELTVRRELPAPHLPVEITLAAAVIRSERYEWLIEKAFELGCRRLIPLTTERTVAKYLPKRPEEKLARWQEIALNAAKQSGLPWLPEVAPITALPDLLAATTAPLFYCWEGLVTTTPSSVVRIPSSVKTVTEDGRRKTGDAVILIGPEGGFTAAEHDIVMAHHPQPLALGPLILRTETAAITAITLVQKQHGYFG